MQQDFEIKDSFKKDHAGNFLFFLAYIALHYSKDSIRYQRTYPYEKYEDFYLTHPQIFAEGNTDLKYIIENKNKQTVKKEYYQSVIDEYKKRIITKRTGQKETWLQVLSLIVTFWIIMFSAVLLKNNAIYLAGVSFSLSLVFLGWFVFYFNVSRVISGKQKNPIKCIKYFPMNNCVFKNLDQAWIALSWQMLEDEKK